MAEQSLTPNLMDEFNALKQRVKLLESAPRWRSNVIPWVYTNGAVRDFGFTSLDTTTFNDVFRVDCVLTAPILDYDLQTWNNWESTAVTSIEWQISCTVYFIDGDTPVTGPTVVASGDSDSGTWSGGAEQFQGSANIVDFMGPGAMLRMCRFDVQIKRTGGSGDGAAIRLVRPLQLRLPTS